MRNTITFATPWRASACPEVAVVTQTKLRDDMAASARISPTQMSAAQTGAVGAGAVVAGADQAGAELGSAVYGMKLHGMAAVQTVLFGRPTGNEQTYRAGIGGVSGPYAWREPVLS